MIPIELLVAWSAIVLAAVWIVRQQLDINEHDEILDEAEEALEDAHKAVTFYQRMLVDVAIGHTTLEITHEGQLIATRGTAGEVQRH